MKPITRRAQEVRGYVEKWLATMRLEHWNVTVTVMQSNKASSPKTLADISARHRYIEASLNVYPYLWECEEGISAKYREATIVHELSHIFLCQMDNLYERLRDGTAVNTEQWNDALEAATESITRALMGR